MQTASIVFSQYTIEMLKFCLRFPFEIKTAGFPRCFSGVHNAVAKFNDLAGGFVDEQLVAAAVHVTKGEVLNRSLVAKEGHGLARGVA